MEELLGALVLMSAGEMTSSAGVRFNESLLGL